MTIWPTDREGAAKSPRALKRTLSIVALLVGMLGTLAVAAADETVGGISITDAWARATPPMAKNGAGYVTLRNAGAADRLIGAQSPHAGKVQFHTSVQDGDVMRMRRVDAVDLPTGTKVAFAPGGYHLMFMGLTGPFTPGAIVAVTLEFERAGAVEVMLAVHKAAPAGSMDHSDHGGMK